VSSRTDVMTENGRAPAAAPGRGPGRPGPQGGPGRPGGAAAPVRGRPGVRRGGPPRTGTGAAHPRAAATAGDVRSSRTPFVFLVVGLLGGGLLCLLLINTILDTGSYQITQLQQQNITLAQQTEELQARIAHEESPAVLARRAHGLGMGEPPLLHFLDLKKNRIENEPVHMAGVPPVPGYAP